VSTWLSLADSRQRRVLLRNRGDHVSACSTAAPCGAELRAAADVAARPPKPELEWWVAM